MTLYLVLVLLSVSVLVFRDWGLRFGDWGFGLRAWGVRVQG